MKILLWIVLLSLFSVGAHADEKNYNWVLEQYEAKSSEINSYSAGEVDGEKYLAVIAGHDDPLLTVFKRGPTRYIGVAQSVSLPFDSSVEVRNNSIFLATSSCHHGCNYWRYQFKNVGQLLKLVGVESQSETNKCYYGAEPDAQSSDCKNHEVQFGNSYNFLASTTICWFDTRYVDDEGHTKQAPQKVLKAYQPRGIQHKMELQRIDLPLLDGIFIYKLSLPKSCYFDYNRKLIKE